MQIDQLVPDDAPEMLRLRRENGMKGGWTYAPGSHGVVVRDGDKVRGFCLIRELGYGYIVDELWCEKTREGVASLGMLGDWIEETFARMARQRGEVLQVGGVVRLDNPAHKKTLENRGYSVVAEVLVREFNP